MKLKIYLGGENWEDVEFKFKKVPSDETSFKAETAYDAYANGEYFCRVYKDSCFKDWTARVKQAHRTHDSRSNAVEDLYRHLNWKG